MERLEGVEVRVEVLGIVVGVISAQRSTFPSEKVVVVEVGIGNIDGIIVPFLLSIYGTHRATCTTNPRRAKHPIKVAIGMVPQITDDTED